jgi:hypothetical protein
VPDDGGRSGHQVVTVARSVTARVFTRDEQVQAHVQAGNTALSVQIILDWLDSRHGLRSWM